MKLELKQQQKLLFAPLMQQSVKMLQVPMLALKQVIEIELEENPLLELLEEGGEESGEEEDQTGKGREEEEIDWNSYLEGMSKAPERTEATSEEEPFNYEYIISKHLSLHEYLFSQLRILPLAQEEMALGEIIIDSIDEDGYLSSSPEDIAQSCGVKTEEVERVLAYIQDLEPIGVGARNLAEAMLIQIKSLGWDKEEPLFVRLISHHLEEVQNRNYSKIARALGIGVEKVEKLVEHLQSLEPKPGRLYSDLNPVYINPDIIIKNVEGVFIVELSEELLPKLQIHPYYKEILLRNVGDEESRLYIKERMKRAVWFLNCLEQRKKTLCKVTEAIFTRQRSFLQFGPSKLVPLRMREVARMCEVNESTVSRAVANKYIQTPWGIFPLKFFFTQGPKDGEEEISSGCIREKIKALILREDRKEPLSDQRLFEMLSSEGLRVTRRTIAKYRRQIGIPPSGFRRK